MARTSDLKLQTLARVPIFRALSKRDLQRISRLGTSGRWPKGTVLMEEGKPGSEFLIVLSGEAAVRRGGRRIETLRPGDFAGEIALLDGGIRAASVIADTELEAEVFNRSEFHDLLRESPEIAIAVLAGTAHRLREAAPRTL